jgi:hypothetical protein
MQGELPQVLAMPLVGLNAKSAPCPHALSTRFMDEYGKRIIIS